MNVRLCDQEDGFRSVMCTIRDDITHRLAVDKEEELLLQAWSDGQWGELGPQLSALCDANRAACDTCGERSLRGNGVHTINVRICRTELYHLLEDDH